jgi:hypothetical protein
VYITANGPCSGFIRNADKNAECASFRMRIPFKPVTARSINFFIPTVYYSFSSSVFRLLDRTKYSSLSLFSSLKKHPEYAPFKVEVNGEAKRERELFISFPSSSEYELSTTRFPIKGGSLLGYMYLVDKYFNYMIFRGQTTDAVFNLKDNSSSLRMAFYKASPFSQFFVTRDYEKALEKLKKIEKNLLPYSLNVEYPLVTHESSENGVGGEKKSEEISEVWNILC